ncbi:hypothetical protein CRG98_050422 [Punica granatum]|uniref:Uncharacterized protein n=1 Tax=Punica granatum TaxID=22663 RepID=A0A2I0GBL4_PUNGR|nr:hypothetical protein CRG98_050422 [Punica granatum]
MVKDQYIPRGSNKQKRWDPTLGPFAVIVVDGFQNFGLLVLRRLGLVTFDQLTLDLVIVDAVTVVDACDNGPLALTVFESYVNLVVEVGDGAIKIVPLGEVFPVQEPSVEFGFLLLRVSCDRCLEQMNHICSIFSVLEGKILKMKSTSWIKLDFSKHCSIHTIIMRQRKKCMCTYWRILIEQSGC